MSSPENAITDSHLDGANERVTSARGDDIPALGGLRCCVNWLPGEKRRPDAGTCLADASCETRCFFNSHATHPDRSMNSVVSAASIPPKSIDTENNY